MASGSVLSELDFLSLNTLNFALFSGCLLDVSFEAPTEVPIEAPTDGELMATTARPAAPAMCDGGKQR